MDQPRLTDEAAQVNFDQLMVAAQLEEARSQLALAKVAYWVAKAGLDPNSSASEHVALILRLRRLIDLLCKIGAAAETEAVPEPAATKAERSASA